MEGDDALLAGVLKKMFEDGFVYVRPSADLDNFTDRARPRVIEIPTNAVAALVSKPDAAESPALLIAFHELQKPPQQFGIVLGPKRVVFVVFGEAVQQCFQAEVLWEERGLRHWARGHDLVGHAVDHCAQRFRNEPECGRNIRTHAS